MLFILYSRVESNFKVEKWDHFFWFVLNSTNINWVTLSTCKIRLARFLSLTLKLTNTSKLYTGWNEKYNWISNWVMLCYLFTLGGWNRITEPLETLQVKQQEQTYTSACFF